MRSGFPQEWWQDSVGEASTMQVASGAALTGFPLLSGSWTCSLDAGGTGPCAGQGPSPRAPAVDETVWPHGARVWCGRVAGRGGAGKAC